MGKKTTKKKTKLLFIFKWVAWGMGVTQSMAQISKVGGQEWGVCWLGKGGMLVYSPNGSEEEALWESGSVGTDWPDAPSEGSGSNRWWAGCTVLLSRFPETGVHEAWTDMGLHFLSVHLAIKLSRLITGRVTCHCVRPWTQVTLDYDRHLLILCHVW